MDPAGAVGKVADGAKAIFTARNVGLVIGGAFVAMVVVRVVDKAFGVDPVETVASAIAGLIPGRG